jgi:hypothetical protein
LLLSFSLCKFHLVAQYAVEQALSILTLYLGKWKPLNTLPRLSHKQFVCFQFKIEGEFNSLIIVDHPNVHFKSSFATMSAQRRPGENAKHRKPAVQLEDV